MTIETYGRVPFILAKALRQHKAYDASTKEIAAIILDLFGRWAELIVEAADPKRHALAW